MSDKMKLATDDRGVATLSLARPDKHNAFDDELIGELTDALVELGAEKVTLLIAALLNTAATLHFGETMARIRGRDGVASPSRHRP